ncbi:MAG: DUF362 domain-containing protein [Candidatus Solibacter usitatus]|nr:DUF362 domain-containing protein [Candidatus Solibacter usitatus]
MRIPCSRRRFLESLGAAAAARQLALGAQTSSKAEASKLAMPGLYRGRVVAVESPASIVSGRYQGETVKQMFRKGMTSLTGAGGWAEGWRQFVSPGDVVGIKVNPVGAPHVISAPEVLSQIIDGLRAAGLKANDIVVYDRYHDQFYGAGFHKWLPEGVRISNAAKDYEEIQQAIEGYDPDHYLDMALTRPGYDLSNLTARRSYAARFITKEVNKLINVCVLKDHQSAGVTLALKNLSHGLVNNVSRSHATRSQNACGAFIPAVVSLPVIRNKAVLHVMDGIKGLYHGGPGARPQFVWEHKTLYFATDPVALDHVGWRVIDDKRVSAGKKKLVEDTPDEFSTFVHRQPEHVEIAGALGLGEWEWSKIDLRRITV